MNACQVQMWVDAASAIPMRVGTVVRSKSTGRIGMVMSFGEMAEVMFEVRWLDGLGIGIMRASEIDLPCPVE